MSKSGLLLFEPSEHSEGCKVARLLHFFGVSAVHSTVTDFLAMIDGPAKARLLCSASAFLKVAQALKQRAEARAWWQERVQSVFVYAARNTGSLEELAIFLTGGEETSLVRVPADTAWVVSDRFPAFCKSMSGVRVASGGDRRDAVLHLGNSATDAVKIVSCEAGAALLKVELHDVPVFLSTTDGVIDLDSSLASPQFDIRRDFLSAAPAVMYIKWAFEGACWQTPITIACLVIDDPPLRPRYGFLEFQLLLDLMREHDFSTSIAFIPWNWNRSTASVVRLFRENPDRYSLSVHGCDHTGGEFGTADVARLAWKSREAAERMTRHASRTGIGHDPVMVFPRGVFSGTAMRVLKRFNFISVVNTEVSSVEPREHAVTVADYWDVAVMSYSSFPIFTRRYPAHGVENFAFDILLGKPCIIVIHHDDCHGRGERLMEFIDRLNALNATLSWRGLGELVRRTCREREVSLALIEIEMYGSELLVENRASDRKRFRISKREVEPEFVHEIRAESESIPWTEADGRVSLEIELSPGESKTVRIIYTELGDGGSDDEGLSGRLKVMLRRYLSEVRANYFTRRVSLGPRDMSSPGRNRDQHARKRLFDNRGHTEGL